jgi:hypothetical protein
LGSWGRWRGRSRGVFRIVRPIANDANRGPSVIPAAANHASTALADIAGSGYRRWRLPVRTADVQDDALALLLDVDDANDTGRLQRGRAPELGRRDEGPRVRSAGDRGVELAAGAGTNVERDGVGGGSYR